MKRLTFAAVVAAALAALTLLSLGTPPRVPAQGVDVFLNVTGGGARKLNIAVPDFTVATGADAGGIAKQLAGVAGTDLTFSQLFSVVAGTGAIPLNNPAALKQSWTDFAAAGAHAGVHGIVSFLGDRTAAEMRLYDLTSPEHRLIATRKFEMPAAQWRRLSHKIADEIVLQFTGEAGVADTKIAYVSGARGSKEIVMADYDGANLAPVTNNRTINLMPMWSPDARSLAFTSYMQGYPDLYRAFPFEKRPAQTLAAHNGINTSPAWSPDGRNVALTLSKDGNPEVYVLAVATGTLRRLTRHGGIDTEPTWSPTGREIAFISDRSGRPHVYLMDAEGANVRPLTTGGHHTQPRWSPKGDMIVFTQRQGTHDIWAVNLDGSSPRRLTSGPGDNQGPTWAPNGRHLMFQSNRLGTWQLFSMLLDGSAQTPMTKGPVDATSPSWSPRLP